MSYYRLYFISPGNGHILRFAEFEAPDDEAALSLSREHEGEMPLELWSKRRKIARIEPVDGVTRVLARWRGNRSGRGLETAAGEGESA